LKIIEQSIQVKMDTENVYKNYYYSETQKSRNLVRISVDIILPNQILTCINWKYKWYLLIKWVVCNDEIVQSRLTGEWLITDIGYSWSRGKLEQNVNCEKKLANTNWNRIR
jgi:hypothetical protein